MSEQRVAIRTIAELAREFGVSSRKLSSIIGHDHNAPKPEIEKKSSRQIMGVNNNFLRPQYPYEAMKAWWKARSES